MKKLMTSVMAAALMFAVAGQASAAALETSGQYRARYWYLSDYHYKDGDKVESTFDMWDQRLRLNMAWQVAEGVKVAARADILENVWDFSGNDAVAAAGSKDEIDFDQVYAVFGFGPTTITAGKQDVSFGTGMLAQADNRYRFKVATKIDPVSLSLSYDMVTETLDDKAKDDNWAVTFAGVMPMGTNTLGALVAYGNSQATAGLEATRIGVDGFFKGAFGGVKLNAEVAYYMGENDYDAKKDVDVEALMAYVGAFMPAGPVNMGVEVAYSQGDDPSSDDLEGVVSQDYQGPFNSFILFNPFDLNGWVSNLGTDFGVQNALAGKVSGSFVATKELTFTGAVVYAMADQTAKGQDDEMGIEVDLLASYAVNANVTANVGFGYLSAGDYFGDDVEDPWVGTVHFVVNF